MPPTLTYPGVYVQEIPSEVRPIMGVATSITAFVGRALRGPIDDPQTLNSYRDFERVFGGLWDGSSVGFAVRDFFLNGGSQAVVVRLYHADPGDDGRPVEATLALSNVSLVAAAPGTWGNQLRARVDHDTRPTGLGKGGSKLFNLFVHDGLTGTVESFCDVSVEPTHERAIDLVLQNESHLVRVTGSLPAVAPAAQAAPTGEQDVWGDHLPVTNVKVVSGAEASDGAALDVNDFIGPGKEHAKQGLYALERTELFNLLCIPPYLSGDVDTALVTSAASYCERRRALLLVDPPSTWSDTEAVRSSGVAWVGTSSRNAALYYPRLRQPNPLKGGIVESFVPCGAVAGVIARTDAQRGVWRAPAGVVATLTGVPELATMLADTEGAALNTLGVNCLRTLPLVGPVVWGARTARGADALADEYKYVPVRRLALFIEESLDRGLRWVAFEPNDEPLWSQIRLNVGAFMHDLYAQGAFQGTTSADAYFVNCDRTTTAQNDINLGIVNIVVGFAPLQPAEFLVIRLQMPAGRTA
jgi:phage tail sheath protein FI